jgi:hypothetical protein
MPFLESISGKICYTKQEVDALLFATFGRLSASGRKILVVESTGWTLENSADTENEDWYYTDLTHNTGNELTIAVSAIGANAFLINSFQKQKAVNANTLRVYVAYPPAYTIRFMLI